MLDAAFIAGFTGMAPNTGPVSLHSLTGQDADGDVYADGVAYAHCWQHKPNRKDIQTLGAVYLGVTLVKFTLVNQGEATKPKKGDYIQKEDGTKWKIQEMFAPGLDGTIGGLAGYPLYDCFCVTY